MANKIVSNDDFERFFELNKLSESEGRKEYRKEYLVDLIPTLPKKDCGCSVYNRTVLARGIRVDSSRATYHAVRCLECKKEFLEYQG